MLAVLSLLLIATLLGLAAVVRGRWVLAFIFCPSSFAFSLLGLLTNLHSKLVAGCRLYPLTNGEEGF